MEKLILIVLFVVLFGGAFAEDLKSNHEMQEAFLSEDGGENPLGKNFIINAAFVRETFEPNPGPDFIYIWFKGNRYEFTRFKFIFFSRYQELEAIISIDGEELQKIDKKSYFSEEDFLKTEIIEKINNSKEITIKTIPSE